MMEPQWMTLSDFQGGLCWWCDLPLGRDKTVDHFIPRGQGGFTGVQNSVVAHGKCNNDKGCRMPTAKECLRLWQTRAGSKNFPVSREIRDLAMPAAAKAGWHDPNPPEPAP